ncbi:cysteine hydrolase [Xenophilus arseniciresistens]|uniref:Cysteine hydrolase n=1 Tax=Xenophilus arseniciresistens TaxID=1283306 RepID=A0AAE3NBX5_9BURK|nr:isochorismatase family cysteine hydrolase [Xenophilus arseniciresistens]MDA7418299.1 cysteine hydrolase [Xenophilus arseniciresistens]
MNAPLPASRPDLAHPGPPEIRFGPSAHSAWTLGADGSVSFVRHAPPPRPLRLAATPQPVQIDLARTALVVVDMQNDFCHPEGWFAQKGLDIGAARRPIAVLQTLLPAWRAAGATVLWLNWGIRADRLNLSPTVQFKGKGRADGVGYGERSPLDRGPSLVQGEWGARRIDELEADPADITVHKHRLSGFWDSELDSVLRHQGVSTLLFAGINTDRCVFTTLQDAAFLGYDCVLLEDACATSSPTYVSDGVLYLVRLLHGFVASAADLMPALEAARVSALSSASSAS